MRQNAVIICISYNYVLSSLLNVPLLFSPRFSKIENVYGAFTSLGNNYYKFFIFYRKFVSFFFPVGVIVILFKSFIYDIELVFMSHVFITSSIVIFILLNPLSIIL